MTPNVGGMPMQVVGDKMQGALPHPPIQAMSQVDTMSDLQRMLKAEQDQHQQVYNYANGAQ